MKKRKLHQVVCGIYKITNVFNQKFYIGSAVDCLDRWMKHKSSANKQKHHSKHFQRSWNKYGTGGFSFEVIEIVENETDLIKREQFYLDTLKPWDRKIGYNICKIAGNLLGTKRTVRQKKMFSLLQKGRIPWNKGLTKEQHPSLMKMSLHRLQNYSGDNAPNKGRKHTENAKKKMRAKRSKQIITLEHKKSMAITRRKTAKINEKQAEEIRSLYKLGNYSQYKLGKMFGIARSTVQQIVEGRTWKSYE